MQVVLKELDQTRIRYEAMVQRVGDGVATMAFSRALNHEGRKTFTAVKREMRKQTSIPVSMITAAMKFKASSRAHLRTIISGSGRPLPLRLFGAKQYSYGVRATVWGRAQQFKSAFIVASKGGNVFHRTSRKRLPIEKMYGPGIPQEMVKGDVVATFERSRTAVMERAMHEIKFILGSKG